jgi:small GTP-binding protein
MLRRSERAPVIQKKLALLGAAGVGKTSLVRRFVSSLFDDKYLTTIGVKVDKKVIRVDSNDVTLMIWDIAGSEGRFSIPSSYVKGASGYLLVADGTRPDTLEAAVEIVAQMDRDLGELPFVLVVNKKDLVHEWRMQAAKLEAFRTHGVAVMTSSAKTGEGVEEAFRLLAESMVADKAAAERAEPERDVQPKRDTEALVASVAATESALARPAAQRGPVASHAIFLCYRREDTEDAAGRLYDRLVDAYGSDRLFMDIDSVPLGIDFVDHVAEQISRCSAVIVMMGKQWLTIKDKRRRRRLDNQDDLVRAEVRAALQRKIPVIPVVVQGASMPVAEELPEDIRLLARRNGILLRSEQWKEGVDRLMKELDKLLPRKS